MEQQAAEVPPAAGWASGPLGDAQRAQRRLARETAAQARALAAFAGTRPASADRPAGEPGAMSADRRAARPEVLAEVSEWAAQEIGMALSLPTSTAQSRLAESLTLVHRLPQTLRALESGLLHVGHLWAFLENVASVADAAKRARLEADLLAWVAARAGKATVTTPAQLGAKIRRELLSRSVRDAARELEDRLRQRGVALRPDRVAGMASLSALLTMPEAAALVDALGQYADAIVDDPAAGMPRTRQQKMADCLLDLVLRPGETDLPVVRAQVTVVVPVATTLGGDQPAEIGGEPVPAELVRALAQGLGLLPSPAPADETEETTAHASADAAAAEEAWWAEVEARVAAGGFDDPPPEEQQRLWEEEAAAMTADPEWMDRLGRLDDPGPLPVAAPPGSIAASAALAPAGLLAGEESALGTESSWWAAADAAVDEASAAQLVLDQALGRARLAVRYAEIADLADTDAWDESARGRVSCAPDALAALGHATDAQRAALADLLERSTGGGLVDRPRIALTDALTGALLALTDARALRAAGTCGQVACRTGRTVCDHDLSGRPGLGPPPPTDGYRPSDPLERFLRARDRRCRQPGCRRPISSGELDHNRPYPDGPTAAEAMTGFCTGHHRGKHQARGWAYDLDPHTGVLTVTTPTGMTATTEPPPF